MGIMFDHGANWHWPDNTTNSTNLKLSVLSLGTFTAPTPGTISLDNSQTYNDL